jgi:hypothetical protein
VLLRLLDDDKLKKELALLNKLEGSADGMLVLGEDTRDINVRVMASDIQLDAVYQRIPFPLKIKGGSLLLDGSRIVRLWESPVCPGCPPNLNGKKGPLLKSPQNRPALI